MSFGPRLRTRVSLCDDDDECPAREPLWRSLLVALAPVVLTGALELWIDRVKRERESAEEAPPPKRRAR